MQFFKNFRLLYRQTKSESDVSALLPKSSNLDEQGKRSTSATFAFYDGIPGIKSEKVTAPVFVPIEMSLPSFNPCVELYSLEPVPSATLPAIDAGTTLGQRITDLDAQLHSLREDQASLEQDLVDYRTDLLNARSELYSEMLKSARHQQRAMDDFRTIQKLEARYQRFCGLLVDIGIHRNTVDIICQVLETGNGSADDILVDAIRDASNDDNTLLARLKPITINGRTPEHYQSALNMTLGVRKQLKSQKKKSKFWKKLAQEDCHYANTITPSPSDISSIREDLTPERQGALNALMARRRAARYAEGDVFGGMRRESSLDILASSLASRSQLSVQRDSRLSASLSSSTAASSTSTAHLSKFSGISHLPRDSTAETPIMASRLPSALSTSLRHSTRSSSQSIVLGSVDLNVSRSPSVGVQEPDLIEEEEENANQETGTGATVTVSQELIQNVGRASLSQGHRRIPSTVSRRSAGSTNSSFRISTSSPMRSLTSAVAKAFPIFNAPTHRTPDMRLSDLESTGETPARSEVSDNGTPFDNSAFHSLLYGGNATSTPSDTPLSPSDTQVDSTLDSISKSSAASNRESRFLEHLNEYSNSSLGLGSSVSISTAASDGLAGANGESKESLFTSSHGTPTSGPTTPSKTPPAPRSTPSKTGRSMLPVLKHLRSLSSSPDGLMNKLRSLRTPPRSPDWRTSPGSSECASGSENLSPRKGSGIPILRRRMTVRARRMSVVRKL
ncbi:hypothetical protein PAXRUDRAFT_635130 [Paxillus rubicundulus Ve08.2h10]|uniref:Uncharacterized protein n=1 Tax=Paxillus rubicundulus Ve08.2h10 TaxID=930991 RepID=A0A0D0DJQ5_9AGAM|nr:hypothetical protein PAXRUDRAFT_635130 [Paxillus rubicundulus Ve08.2h10]